MICLVSSLLLFEKAMKDERFEPIVRIIIITEEGWGSWTAGDYSNYYFEVS